MSIQYNKAINNAGTTNTSTRVRGSRLRHDAVAGRAHDIPISHEKHLVAVLSFVENMAGDNECCALFRQIMEEIPQLAPQQRVKADSRLV